MLLSQCSGQGFAETRIIFISESHGFQLLSSGIKPVTRIVTLQLAFRLVALPIAGVYSQVTTALPFAPPLH